MKTYFSIFVGLILASYVCQAQKHDYIWVLGHNGGTTIDFNSTPPAIEFANRSAVMHVTNASMADNNGNLLFYTNGCDIFNKENNVMENGNNINPGPVHNEYCAGAFNTYVASNGAIALPQSDSFYYLFHLSEVLKLDQPIIDFYSDRLYYSVINMNSNNGLGKVMQKNKLIIEDTLHSGDLAVVIHSNNKDWWIINPKRYSNKYFKVLFVSDGSMALSEQEIGDSTFVGSDGGGQALFSPDGKKYVRYNPQSDIMLFDFDRATGELSNYHHIEIPGDSAFVGGAAISPNSRYLYISSQVWFYQYDLQAPDIAASQVLLGEYDGYASPNPPNATTFYNCRLAPDCKIYCNCYNGCDVLHVVNYPDEPGLACGFEQHGVQLASSNALSLPNFPNYRLGTGQPPCIPTATAELEKEKVSVTVYPNPTSEQVSISWQKPLVKPAVFHLIDPLGREVRREVLSAGQQQVEVGLVGVPPGLYFWSVEVKGRKLGSSKLVVTK